VLWVLLLLSALASAAAFMARTNAILAHKLGKFAQTEAAADAAVISAISKLSDEKTSRRPPIDSPQTWEFQGIPVTVSITEEAGRIDVNTADDDLLLAFFYSEGVTPEQATTLLSDLRKLQGVVSGPAPSGRLRTIEELKKVSSWAAQNLDCWSDSLTVYSGLPGVSISDATGRVRAALKWARDHHAESHDDSTTAIAVKPSVPSDRSMLGDVIRIVARVSRAPDISTSSEWVGRLTGDARQPVLTMRWSQQNSVTTCSRK
jgi:DNA uptake protein ComE-like DNA-binding protein